MKSIVCKNGPTCFVMFYRLQVISFILFIAPFLLTSGSICPTSPDKYLNKYNKELVVPIVSSDMNLINVLIMNYSSYYLNYRFYTQYVSA